MTTAVEKAEAVNIGIRSEDRRAVGEILNRILSDESILVTKTRNYHWNVIGWPFNDLHKFFEAQYDQLNDVVDEVAERARALAVPSYGTLSEFLKSTRLKEAPGQVPSAKEMVANLLADHESIIRFLRQDAETTASHGDMGTNDFLIGLMEQHEKMAWMLRSSLE